MDMNPDVPDVIAKLQALGSPRQIAAFFESEGVTGYVKSAYACPVANYLVRETGCPDAIVDHYTVAYSPDPAERDEVNLVSIYGTPVGDFVAGFDLGLFSQLREDGSSDEGGVS
jgi:hypothetical protein